MVLYILYNFVNKTVVHEFSMLSKVKDLPLLHNYCPRGWTFSAENPKEKKIWLIETAYDSP